MRLWLLFPLALIAACSPAAPERNEASERAAAGQNPLAGAPLEALRPETPWASLASADGYVLRLTGDAVREVRLTLSCLSPGRVVVNAPGFTPIVGEGRFLVGLGDEPLALVADPARQAPGGGVTAEAPIPVQLGALVAGASEVTARYGNQQSGPHPPPPAALVQEFVRACEAVRAGGQGTAPAAGTLTGG